MNIHMKHNHPAEFKQQQRREREERESLQATARPKCFECPHEGCDAKFKSENTLKLHLSTGHRMEDCEEFTQRVNMVMKARIQESIEDMDFIPTSRSFEPEEPEMFSCKECNAQFRYVKRHFYLELCLN